MSDIENLRVLADAASESSAYEDLYKYASKILEQDISDAKAWVEKGIAAAFLTDTTGSRISEARVLIKKGIELGVAENIKAKLPIQIKEAYLSFVDKLNDEFSGNVKDYQKVTMPEGGSAIVHGLAQAVNKIQIAKSQAGSRVKGLELASLLLEVAPTHESYQFADLALASLYDFSKKNGKFLDGEEDYCVKFKQILNSTSSDIKTKFPDFNSKSANALTPKSEGCFIATAAVGEYDHPKVMALRQYRDKFLLPSSAGRLFVKCYYYLSPPIARQVAKNKVLKFLIMRFIVNPAVKFTTLRSQAIKSNKSIY